MTSRGVAMISAGRFASNSLNQGVSRSKSAASLSCVAQGVHSKLPKASGSAPSFRRDAVKSASALLMIEDTSLSLLRWRRSRYVAKLLMSTLTSTS